MHRQKQEADQFTSHPADRARGGTGSERALKTASLMLAEQDALENGDQLTVTQG